MSRILHFNVQVTAAEIFFDFKSIPFFRYGRCDTKTIEIRTHSKNTFHTSYHNSRRSSSKPVYMRTAKIRTCFPLCKLTIAVWFKTTEFGTVILRSRRIFHKISKSTFSMTAECFSKNQPALGLGENTGVFFGTLIIDNCQCTIESMRMIRRIHKDRTIFCV